VSLPPPLINFSTFASFLLKCHSLPASCSPDPSQRFFPSLCRCDGQRKSDFFSAVTAASPPQPPGIPSSLTVAPFRVPLVDLALLFKEHHSAGSRPFFQLLSGPRFRCMGLALCRAASYSSFILYPFPLLFDQACELFRMGSHLVFYRRETCEVLLAFEPSPCVVIK